jgi:hypothetical protein
MTDLLPAAQAVLDAYRSTHLSINNLVAALRAAADQASPKLHIEDIDYQHQSYVDGWNDSLELILAIADELDDTSPSS